MTDLLEQVRFVLPAIFLIGLWCIEGRLHPQPLPSRLWHAGFNISLAFVNAIVLAATLVSLTVMVMTWCEEHSWGLLSIIGSSKDNAWRLGLRWSLAMLSLDLFSYAWHRLNHTFDFLWRFHQLHHSDRQMDATTAARFHVLELTISAIVRLPYVVVLGITVPPLLLYETILVCNSLTHHAHLDWGRWDRRLRTAVVTPAMHRVHHGRSMSDSSSNYASVLSIWDRLFGTLNADCDRPHLPTGLPDADVGEDSGASA